MIRDAFLWACFHVWLRIPSRWTFSRPGMWLLQYAGEYANRPLEGDDGRS